MTNDFFAYCQGYQANEKHHLAMLPEGRKLSSQQPLEFLKPRESAVGIHLFTNEHGNPSFFLIQRSEYEGKHSGQYGFPGGKRELSDVNLEQCARRECMEELGIRSEQGICLNVLSPVYIPVSNFIMHAFLFAHESVPFLLRNEREIQQVIEIDLAVFASETPISWKEMTHQEGSRFIGKVPGFQWNEHWIWGATALVLNELKALFIAYEKSLKSNGAPKGPI